MPDRRYDEDETRRIFDEASRVPSLDSGTSSGAERGSPRDGFTLAELQEIAAEAGLDPACVAEAARALDSRGPPPALTHRLFGLPIGVARTVALPTRFDDESWNRLVVDLRETFDARGTLRTQGDFREWSNGNLQALVEPWEGGYRLRMSTRKGQALPLMGAGGTLMILAVVQVLGGGTMDLGALGGPLLLALMGVGFAGASALQLPSWARTRARQMEEVAARAVLPPADEDADAAS